GFNRERSLLKFAPKCFAFDILGRHVMVLPFQTDLVNRYYVRMVQSGSRDRFLHEAPSLRFIRNGARIEQRERTRSSKTIVEGFIDFDHAAGAYAIENGIMGQFCADHYLSKAKISRRLKVENRRSED